MGREAKDIVTTAINSVTASPGRLVGYPDNGRDQMTVQAEVVLGGGTITYSIEGRLRPDFSWVKLSADLTDNALVALPTCPELRVRVTAQTGAAAVTAAAVLMR